MRNKYAQLAFCFIAVPAFLGIGSVAEEEEGASMATLQITSTSFEPNGVIPKKYTCEGEDVSPPLEWHGPPSGTKSFALISDDPDAPVGTWVHWVVYDLPIETRELGEGLAKTDVLPNGAKQGMTDFRRIGYGGPCPPPGSYHRYFFRLYALDTTLAIRSRQTKQQLLKAMEGHVLAQGELIGRYKR